MPELFAYVFIGLLVVFLAAAVLIGVGVVLLGLLFAGTFLLEIMKKALPKND